VRIEQPIEDAPVAPARTTRKQKALASCGVCHTDILDGEAMTRCPGCSSTFHTDCWIANYGCSSYGCTSVNSLKPDREERPAETTKVAVDEDRFPWEFALLGGSVASLVLGVLAFGVPSTFVAVATAIMTLRRGKKRVGILAVSGAVAIVGLVVGLEISSFWWLGRPLDWVRR
jgi:hypothetical protein